MRRFLLLAGLGLPALTGCASSGTSATAIKSPAPTPVHVADARPTRNAQGHLVTLADLTANEPQFGQTFGLAESTPGATAAMGEDAPSADFDNLEIVDDNLRAKLAVLRIGSGRGDSNLLSVFAGVKNKTAHRLDLEMQTLYRDKDGHSLSDGLDSWIPITLKPHEETQYRSVALSEDATDFTVRVRRAPEKVSAGQ